MSQTITVGAHRGTRVKIHFIEFDGVDLQNQKSLLHELIASTSPKYVSSDDDDDDSDDDALFPNGTNESNYQKAREGIGTLGSTSWGSRGFAWARKKKYMWAQETLGTWEGENEELAQGKETISSLKSSIGALQDSYDVLQKTHKDL
jgi:hypothetical protein